VVEVDGVRVTVRYVNRNGRRARIAITAPAGATFEGNSSQLQSSAGRTADRR
jgi:hypothetical protein